MQEKHSSRCECIQQGTNTSCLYFLAIFATSAVTVFMVIAIGVAIPICGNAFPELSLPAYLLYLVRAVVHPILEAFTAPEIRVTFTKYLPKRLQTCCTRKKRNVTHAQSQ